jgi:eukaryotic-like serine/threonine-protein kinase
MRKIGKYEILREIGKGASSVVYAAHDPFRNREVAIKLLLPDALGDIERGRRYRKLFVTEASLAGKLAHPHIVAIYDAASDADASYIVMEYVNGPTLEAHTRADNLLPVPRVVEIAYKCARALDYAARQGVIHRDIKPANILLAGESDIKISDFGTALTSAAETTQLTGVGSPAYMSPEQVREQPLTLQSDIYSLGVVMYHLLTGRVPFQGSNHYSTAYQIVHIEPPPPGQFRQGLAPGLEAIVMRALAKDTAVRYATWDAFAQDLAGALAVEPGAAREVPESGKFNMLRSFEFFRRFSDVELWEVLRLARWNRYPRGEVLIREGEIGTAFYVLVSGEVAVTIDGRLLNTLHAGECFGEMGYLGRQKLKRSASVTAASDVTAIEVGADALDGASELCRHHFNGAFLGILVDRLAMANTRVSQLLAERKISVF